MSKIKSFEFLYSKRYDRKNYKSFHSKKDNLKVAMDNFLTKKGNLLYDIDEEVKVIKEDESEEYIYLDIRQQYDLSFFFVLDNEKIFGNGCFS
jgi:hypothetical protein